MKSKALLSVILFAASLVLHAQQGETILVNAGEDVSKAIPRSERYRYPAFTNGQLYYPQGKRSDVIKLNYNLLVGAMQFIDHRGDTMFIAEESNIFKYVQVGSDLYYHDFELGYFEMLTREGPVKLLSQLKWKVVRKEAVINNGYGSSASVGSTEYTSRRSDINTFVQNENSIFGKDLSYFLLGHKDKIYKATKTGFIKAFADHKKKLKTYFSEETIDFRNAEDLKALLDFCHEFNNS